MAEKKFPVIPLVMLLVLLLTGVWGEAIGKQAKRTNAEGEIAAMESVFTEAEDAWEEQKAQEVKPVNKNEVTFDVNTRWVCKPGESEIALRLYNPTYSAYPIQVEIYLEDQPDEILYRSEVIKPGESEEKVKLSKTFESGSYQAVIKYYFYKENNEQEIFGEHEVGALLSIS